MSAPEADIVQGLCKRCPKERAFPSRIDETDRGNDHEDLTRQAPALQRVA